jgi:hypothetical protein
MPWRKRLCSKALLEVHKSYEAQINTVLRVLSHLYWFGLDVHLSVQSIRNSSSFPLVSGEARLP